MNNNLQEVNMLELNKENINKNKCFSNNIILL